LFKLALRGRASLRRQSLAFVPFFFCEHPSASVSIRQHPSAYVSACLRSYMRHQRQQEACGGRMLTHDDVF
jgi:Zn-finger protein